MKYNENDVSSKFLHGIHNSSDHGVHNIIIYNMVSHNFKFRFRFQDITLCWNLCINSITKTRTHKFQQTRVIS